MAKTCFGLINPNEGELLFRRLNKRIKNIMNLQRDKEREGEQRMVSVNFQMSKLITNITQHV